MVCLRDALRAIQSSTCIKLLGSRILRTSIAISWGHVRIEVSLTPLLKHTEICIGRFYDAGVQFC